MRRFRFQFSLLTLFLVVTIVALVLSLFVMHGQWRRAVDENLAYRNEYGHLTISDPNRLHALEVHVNENYQWRWRVHVPDRRRFNVRFAVRDIPLDAQFPTADDQFDVGGIAPGEHTILAGVTRDPEGKRIFQVAVVDDITMRADLEGEKGNWVDMRGGFTSWTTAGTHATVSVPPGEPLTLLRLRHVPRTKRAGGKGSPMIVTGTSSSDGFLVWIEEANTAGQSSIKTGPPRKATP